MTDEPIDKIITTMSVAMQRDTAELKKSRTEIEAWVHALTILSSGTLYIPNIRTINCTWAWQR